MEARASGFTLLEVVLALALIAITVIAVAPLFVYASQETGAAGDLGVAEARAVRRMELLRARAFGQLVNGGSLESNTAGYYESSPDCTVRWTIANKPGGPAPARLVTVRAVAVGPAGARVRKAELVTVRSD